MWSFFVPSMTVVVFAVVYLLRYYAASKVPFFVRLITVAAWVTSIGIVALVPIDIWATISHQQSRAIGNLWSVCYWTTQLLTWLVIPWTQGFCDAGDFTWFRRLFRSIKDNVYFYIFAAAAGFIGFILLLTVGKMSVAAMPDFLIMVVTAYGLVAVTFLLGFGLVEMPRVLWRKSEPESRLLWHQHRVGKAAAALEAASKELHRVVIVVEATSQPMSRRDALRPHMDIVCATLNQYSPIKKAAVPTDAHGRISLDDLSDADLDYGSDEQGLAKLHRRLNHAISGYNGCKAEYAVMVRRALELEVVCKCRATRSYAGLARSGAAQWYLAYKCVVRPYVLKAGSMAAAAVSFAVVWSEATIGFGRDPDLSPFSQVIHAVQHGEVATQVLVMLPLAYMCMASHFSMFKLGMFRFYHLVPHHTETASLLLNAGLVCRFIAPLCYNFLHVIRFNEYLAHGEVTTFTKKMGAAMSDIPLFGHDFNTWFPLVIVVYCGLLFLNVWDVVARMFVSSRFRFDELIADDEHSERGKLLLRQEADALARGLAIGDTLPTWGTVEDPPHSMFSGSRGGGTPPRLETSRTPSRSAGSVKELAMQRTRPAGDRPSSRLQRPAGTPAAHPTGYPSGNSSAARPAPAAAPAAAPGSGLSLLTRSLMRNKHGSTDSLSSQGTGVEPPSRAPASVSGLDAIFARVSAPPSGDGYSDNGFQNLLDSTPDSSSSAWRSGRR